MNDFQAAVSCALSKNEGLQYTSCHVMSRHVGQTIALFRLEVTCGNDVSRSI